VVQGVQKGPHGKPLVPNATILSVGRITFGLCDLCPKFGLELMDKVLTHYTTPEI
jgi:hypothetical protein